MKDLLQFPTPSASSPPAIIAIVKTTSKKEKALARRAFSG
jgi:hypothetical protein